MKKDAKERSEGYHTLQIRIHWIVYKLIEEAAKEDNQSIAMMTRILILEALKIRKDKWRIE